MNADLATLSDTDPSSGSDTITLTAKDSFNNSAQQQTIAVTASGGPVLTVPRCADGCAQPGDDDSRGEPGGERQHQ